MGRNVPGKRAGLLRQLYDVGTRAHPYIRAGYKLYKAYKDNSKAKNRKRAFSATGITTQRDSKKIYVKRSMPKYKKKQWKKFTKKVTAAIRDEGTQVIVMNDQNTVTSYGASAATGIRLQAIQAAHLYGVSVSGLSVSEIGNMDMYRLCERDDDIDEASKFTMISGVMDMTITNPTTGTYSGPLEIDLYDISYGAPIGSTLTGLGACFSSGYSNDTALNVSNPKVDISYRGVTPFDCGNAISISKMKIIFKTKYFLPAGDSFTYQIRDSKNHHMSSDVLQSPHVGFADKRTRSVFLVVKPTLDCTSEQTFAMLTKVTRTYKYRKSGISGSKSLYLF